MFPVLFVFVSDDLRDDSSKYRQKSAKGLLLTLCGFSSAIFVNSWVLNLEYVP